MCAADVSSSDPAGIFRHEFIIPDEAIDRNGHVNNVMYVQWMQDVAVMHSSASGGTAAMEAAGATWVVRSHKIEYLNPAFAGEKVLAVTWVVNMKRIRSLRRYQFLRRNDGLLLAKGETDWVFIAPESGRPVTIPEEVSSCFPLLPDYE